MNRDKKATLGVNVTPAEINDLIMRARDLRTHVETNKRHLAMIEKRLTAMEVDLAQIKEAFDRVEEEVPVEVHEDVPVPEELDDAEVAEEEEA